jgi:hypothetical protein
MKHDVLGEIERPKEGPFDGVATIRHNSREIEVGLCAGDQPFETTVSLAAEVVRRLPELDILAKRCAAADLLKKYNDGWNEYDEVQDDGSLESVSNPKLLAAEFEAKLSLEGVNVTGDARVEFFYDDENMFWGHSVVVTSIKGIDFSKARATLFG